MGRKSQTHDRTTPTPEVEDTAPVSSPSGNPVKRVRREHRAIIAALNSKPVSFVVRSAEGIPMYRGIESHSNNGNMPEIARAGHAAALKRFHKLRNDEEQAKKEREAKEKQAKESQPVEQEAELAGAQPPKSAPNSGN